MTKYIMRLDDASEYMDVPKWKRMEDLLDAYHIKPLVGIIPDNKDPSLVNVYPRDVNFWETVDRWGKKGWELALHGCYHKYTTQEGGLNPINPRSEFAGVPLSHQCEMIRHGLQILHAHDVFPKVFFAPSHTFDENTLLALKKESNIRVISDTIANDVYFQNDFYFVPQQSGHVRKLPFCVVTFCYHPNMMNVDAFDYLEKFLVSNANDFTKMQNIPLRKRSKSVLDIFLKKLYFIRRR